MGGLIGGGMFGGSGLLPLVGGEPFFHHRRHHEDDSAELESASSDSAPATNATPIDCDALADAGHPGHRDAVRTIAHVDAGAHESILQRIAEELGKL
jgi:hypothetical protein